MKYSSRNPLDRSEPDPRTPDDQREQPQGTELPALRIEKVRGSIPLSSTEEGTGEPLLGS